MPQLNTATWSITILSMILSLFIIIQLKFANHYYYSLPSSIMLSKQKPFSPWETKWTKIYLPLLLPLQ
uniref:ATP synthase complex subunit 8 n=1 Tax=Cyclopes didactylus TaxID=84074 RepID=A0A0S2LLS5_CYCDI|nr:ATP synthase F0 subunit 8 [Cyclopes didactylus]ALO62405.1 ATP synthase F0 subunit 8 [Cyclopes didactylus]